MRYQSVKGFRDIIGVSARIFSFVEKTARSIFKKYNFDEIRIPTVELAELFLRTIGETTDIVEKEMYVFEDKGKRKIALRPEGTAGVVRAYIENDLSQKEPSQKFFYIGQMFRQERPQSGRFREFSQIGCEYFGNPSVYADIEVILLAKEILESSGVKNVKIDINNLGCQKCRPLLLKKIQEILKNNFDGLCDDCKRRSAKNLFRVLDCKIDGDKYKDIKPELCENCFGEFEELKYGLKNVGVNFTVSSKLVRGLDYYTKTVFEITSDVLGSQSAVCAGGRYDNLVKDLGGATTPAVGFAIGVDRLVEIIEKQEVGSRKWEVKNPIIFVVATENDDCKKTAFHILSEIRNSGISADGGYFNKSLKSQMRFANALNSKYVIIVGDEEIKNKKIILRDMKGKLQKEIDIDGAVEEIKKCFNLNS
ncbi:MAG TPA: histidine--tRNA ligase [Elusimicrobia bacterium]|nr:histidine--tRNA ligase [Elusimicrobiota bacterium]